jgi:hypothetical protein
VKYGSASLTIAMGITLFTAGAGFGVASPLLARPILAPAAVDQAMPKPLRQQILDKVWGEINTRYYDPQFNGVD